MMENYRPKEISWLAFNERVLQEAAKDHVPLIERFRFLGIYSNNLDEFFRVRVATLKRIAELGRKAVQILGKDPADILKEINNIVIKQRQKYEEVHAKLIRELEKENIYVVNENQIIDKHRSFIIRYFYAKVRPKLMPIMIDQVKKFPELDDDGIYLATILSKEGSEKRRYALIKVPSDELRRFLVLPRQGDKKYLIFLDDVIRLGLSDLFNIQNYTSTEAYMIKLTKDAELDIDDDLGESYVNKVSKGLQKREEGAPVRLVYDANIPGYFLTYLKERIGISKEDVAIAGGRYHNLKDFINLPNMGSEKLIYPPLTPIMHPAFPRGQRIFHAIRQKDIMLHFPYHSFDHFIDLLREASIDPKVTSIKITLYRLADYSSVISALLNALRNGIQVRAIFELTARFSEQANIEYSQQLIREGGRVTYGVPGLKVHAKLCQITRREKGQNRLYTVVGTGNFNEETAKVFSDTLLFTTNEDIGNEVNKLFEFFHRNYRVGKYHYLVPSPFDLRKKLSLWIKQEIQNANDGKEAYIHLKLNNLLDKEMTRLLLQAADSGVEVKLNVRGMFSLIMPKPELPNFQALAMIDRFLEHTRLFFFCNAGEERVFISSADLMTRNLDRRLELACPVLDKDLRRELRSMFDMQWADNTQMRILDHDLKNLPRKTSGSPIRSQIEFYNLLKETSKG
ncbi:MAG: polyphosphate kinase 1 [Bacteroidales bacterium]|nr:polyphosphate kinase 1 [Bacteroidales bacterium]